MTRLAPATLAAPTIRAPHRPTRRPPARGPLADRPFGEIDGRPLVPTWAGFVVAAASGPVTDAGFPDRGIWPLTFVGIALVLISLVGRSAPGALAVGFVAGCSFYFTHISWAALFLGPLPMSALSVLESLFVSAGAATLALAYRWIPRVWPGALGRLGLLPVVIGGLWTAREAWSAVWPYGGFSWGRMAMSQSAGPFAPLFAWFGISGVTFVMVGLVALGVEAVRMGTIPAPLRAIVAVAALSAVLVIPPWRVITDGSLRVIAVQGNGKAGYFDRREDGDLLKAQLDATFPLIGTPTDVVLWPEGATDRSPLTDSYTAGAFDYISKQFDAPLVGWAVTERDGLTYNTEMLWVAGRGAVDLYDKKHPVPFGEYVPDRRFWEPFAPDLIGLIAREYTPGRTDNVFDVNGVTVGVNICFDIVDDQILTESVDQGARAIFASSNNADFGHTDESAQQLAIARIRAIELGRSVVNISTVGRSAVIAPDGRILDQLPWYTAGAMVQDVPLSSQLTPAVVIGRQLEWLVSGFSLAAVIIGALALRRRNA